MWTADEIQKNTENNITCIKYLKTHGFDLALIAPSPPS